MWQEIAIILIAAFVVAYVGCKIYRLIKQPISPCDNCVGCSLKEQLKEKNNDCKDFKKKK